MTDETNKRKREEDGEAADEMPPSSKLAKEGHTDATASEDPQERKQEQEGGEADDANPSPPHRPAVSTNDSKLTPAPEQIEVIDDDDIIDIDDMDDDEPREAAKARNKERRKSRYVVIGGDDDKILPLESPSDFFKDCNFTIERWEKEDLAMVKMAECSKNPFDHDLQRLGKGAELCSACVKLLQETPLFHGFWVKLAERKGTLLTGITMWDPNERAILTKLEAEGQTLDERDSEGNVVDEVEVIRVVQPIDVEADQAEIREETPEELARRQTEKEERTKATLKRMREKKAKRTTQKKWAEERAFKTAKGIFMQATYLIPQSVDVWARYGGFMSTMHGSKRCAIADVRRVFEKGLTAVGTHWLSKSLWDKYIEFESRLANHKGVNHLFRRLLKVTISEQPSSIFSRYEKFITSMPLSELIDSHEEKKGMTEKISRYKRKDLTDARERRLKEKQERKEKMEAEREANRKKPHRGWFQPPIAAIQLTCVPTITLNRTGSDVPNQGGTGSISLQDVVDSNVQLSDKSATINVSEPEVKFDMDDITDEDYKQWILKQASRSFDKTMKTWKELSKYESALGRPYYHVEPHLPLHLKGWRNYLKWAEEKKSVIDCVKLYERCIMSCANYWEFWLRYVQWLEAKYYSMVQQESEPINIDNDNNSKAVPKATTKPDEKEAELQEVTPEVADTVKDEFLELSLHEKKRWVFRKLILTYEKGCYKVLRRNPNIILHYALLLEQLANELTDKANNKNKQQHTSTTQQQQPVLDVAFLSHVPLVGVKDVEADAVLFSEDEGITQTFQYSADDLNTKIAALYERLMKIYNHRHIESVIKYSSFLIRTKGSSAALQLLNRATNAVIARYTTQTKESYQMIAVLTDQQLYIHRYVNDDIQAARKVLLQQIASFPNCYLLWRLLVKLELSNNTGHTSASTSSTTTPQPSSSSRPNNVNYHWVLQIFCKALYNTWRAADVLDEDTGLTYVGQELSSVAMGGSGSNKVIEIEHNATVESVLSHFSEAATTIVGTSPDAPQSIDIDKEMEGNPPLDTPEGYDAQKNKKVIHVVLDSLDDGDKWVLQRYFSEFANSRLNVTWNRFLNHEIQLSPCGLEAAMQPSVRRKKQHQLELSKKKKQKHAEQEKKSHQQATHQAQTQAHDMHQQWYEAQQQAAEATGQQPLSADQQQAFHASLTASQNAQAAWYHPAMYNSAYGTPTTT